MKVIFKTDPELSVLHAAAVVGLGQAVVDDKVRAALAGAVENINDRIDMAELDPEIFWKTLVASGADDETVGVEMALARAGCSELVIDTISPAIVGRLADIRMAMRGRFPKLAEQLPLRAGPLKELWEATGPGLLRDIGRQTIKQLIPAKTTLLLVQPVRGGDGGLIEQSDRVWTEAMLTHPEPSIPETLRIAWLVARRGVEGVESNRWVEQERLPEVVSLALIPYVLNSGESLGLCDASDAKIAAAAELWHVATWGRIGKTGQLDRTEPLLKWWSQMRSGELPLPVALKALDKMLV
jgi:hypothetical protein